ncbi:MAG: acyltransferase [Lachnospiraceae bacterium]|nr:acyltransferase [Lachnospiraceae bacterium]
MKKERRNEFDLIRAVSTVWIVLFHYSYTFVQYGVGGEHIFVMKHANGTWGALFVSLFFMLSGASLYYNWGDRMTSFKGKGGVLDFYKKRWLAIFPMFFIAWFIFYLMYVIEFGWMWGWGGPRYRLLLTFFGVDGYFMYRGMNYYTVGEWFLGAIIILYVLYPILQWCMKKIPWKSTTVIVLLFGLNVARRMIPAFAVYNAWVIISDNINIITCLMSFWTGMLLIRADRRLAGKAFVIPALIAGIIIMVIPLPVSTLILSPILAVCFYIVLLSISVWLDGHRDRWKLKAYDKIVGFFSRYSFAIFLVHHVVVQRMMEIFMGREFTYAGSILYFLVNLALISVLAVLLSKIASLAVTAIKMSFSARQIKTSGGDVP